MMGTADAIKSGEGLTLESIWALFRETDALIKQNAKIQEERQAKANAEMEKLRVTVDQTSGGRRGSGRGRALAPRKRRCPRAGRRQPAANAAAKRRGGGDRV